MINQFDISVISAINAKCCMRWINSQYKFHLRVNNMSIQINNYVVHIAYYNRMVLKYHDLKWNFVIIEIA